MSFVLGMFFTQGTEMSSFQKSLGKLIDLLFMIGIIVVAVAYYYYTPESKLKTDAKTLYDDFVNYLTSTFSLLTTALFILTFYIIVYLIHLLLIF